MNKFDMGDYDSVLYDISDDVNISINADEIKTLKFVFEEAIAVYNSYPTNENSVLKANALWKKIREKYVRS